MRAPLRVLLALVLLHAAAWPAAARQHAVVMPAATGPSPFATPVGAAQKATVALSRLTHVVAGRSLVVSGAVENRSRGPIAGLVIDVTGFSPSGAPAAFGSDGIPWTIAPGAKERFAVPLLLSADLVKEYTVQAAWAKAPYAPLAVKTGAVAPSAYRSLVLSLVKVTGSVHSTLLTVTAQAAPLPVTQVSVEATVQAFEAKVLRLLMVTVDVPPNGSVTVPLDAGRATRLELIRLRLTDVRLKADWTD